MFVVESMTPGISTFPAGSCTSCHTFHSCSWRPLAPTIDRAAGRACEQHIDDVSEWYVVVVRCLTGTPADVHADLLRRNVSGGGVERLDILGHYRAELRDREIRKPGAPQGEVGAVELEDEARLDNRFILALHHLRHGFQIRFSGRIIAVGEKIGERARRDGGHEHLSPPAGRRSPP